jgi:hypothetical protein
VCKPSGHRSRHERAVLGPTDPPRYRGYTNGVSDVLMARISSCFCLNPLLKTLPGGVVEKQPANGAWKPRE